jgi:hypothetical protein
MTYLIISATALVLFLIGRQSKKRKQTLNVKPDFLGNLVFEDIVVRKRKSEVWVMYENKPQLMIINYVSCSSGKYGIDIQYNLRLENWSDGCIGIEKIRENQMFDTKEALLKTL